MHGSRFDDLCRSQAARSVSRRVSSSTMFADVRASTVQDHGFGGAPDRSDAGFVGGISAVLCVLVVAVVLAFVAFGGRDGTSTVRATAVPTRAAAVAPVDRRCTEAANELRELGDIARAAGNTGTGWYGLASFIDGRTGTDCDRAAADVQSVIAAAARAAGYQPSNETTHVDDGKDGYWDSRPSNGDGGGSGGYGSSGGYYDPSTGWHDCTSYDPCPGSQTDRVWAETFDNAGPALDPWGRLTGAPGLSYDDPWGGTQLGGNCAFYPNDPGC
jgi:hypothetical protein